MDDQQLAGLVMWMPGNMIYFFELMLIVALWLRDQERQASRPSAHVSQAPVPQPSAVSGPEPGQESKPGAPPS
jgi:hypothetical protein